MSEEYASLDIPFLPADSPEMETPEDFKLCMYPHQKRALHRMLLIEREKEYIKDAFVGRNFGCFLNYDVKGGVLCDGIGVGKTAMVLATICSEPRDASLGPNLIVLPNHLLEQWQTETAKFCPDGIRVIAGLDEYQREVRQNPGGIDNRTLVLVTVRSVLRSPSYHYDFRRLYRRTTGDELELNAEQRELYRSKACFISQGFKGPMYGHGGPKQQALFFPHMVLKKGENVGFRRVLFDEIQDLVEEGKEEKDCLLQLVKHTQNVWLITATPFPKAGASVYANHQLLGFKRLRIECESASPLPRDSPFEIIKRKLYIRSPMGTRADCVQVNKISTVDTFKLSKLEQFLYENEKMNMALKHGRDNDTFCDVYMNLRKAITHLAISDSVREELAETFQHNRGDWRRKIPTIRELAFNGVRGLLKLAEELCYKRKIAMRKLDDAYNLLLDTEIPATESFGDLVREMLNKLKGEMRERGFYVWEEDWLREVIAKHEIRNIRTPLEKHVARGENYISGDTRIIKYVRKKLSRIDDIPNLSANNERVLLRMRDKVVRTQDSLKLMRAAFKEFSKSTMDPSSKATPRFGSKLEKLCKLLKELQNDKIIIFAAFKGTVSIAKEVLRRQRIEVLTLEGIAEKRNDVLREFTQGSCKILLANMEESASGTNLQVANHMIFLEIPGNSLDAATAIVAQAQGRVVRMGQSQNVKITYLAAEGTLEPLMIEKVEVRLKQLARVDDNSSYCVESRGSKVPKVKVKKVEPEDPADKVEVVQSLTVEEKLAQSLKQAEDSGNIISLLDEEFTIGFDAAPLFKKRARSTENGGKVTIKSEKPALSESGTTTVKVEKSTSQPSSKRVKLKQT